MLLFKITIYPIPIKHKKPTANHPNQLSALEKYVNPNFDEYPNIQYKSTFPNSAMPNLVLNNRNPRRHHFRQLLSEGLAHQCASRVDACFVVVFDLIGLVNIFRLVLRLNQPILRVRRQLTPKIPNVFDCMI